MAVAVKEAWGVVRDGSGLITKRAIASTVSRIVAEFQPDRIYLFGSYAYGQPHEWSDVDILVVMPARNEIDQAVKIWQALDPPFSLDVIVRTPSNLKRRLAWEDSFLQEIVDRGVVLYEKEVAGMGKKSVRRSGRRPRIEKGQGRTA